MASGALAPQFWFQAEDDNGVILPGALLNFLGRWSAVVSLLQSCRPSAVARLIVAFRVDSVKAISLRWSWSHIFKKGFKAVTPAFAHLHAFGAVIFPTCLFLVAASCFRSSPRAIGKGITLKMFRVDNARGFIVETAAAFRIAFTKMLPEHVGGSTTVTSTPPCSAFLKTWLEWCAFKNSQAAESLSSVFNRNGFHGVYKYSIAPTEA